DSNNLGWHIESIGAWTTKDRHLLSLKLDYGEMEEETPEEMAEMALFQIRCERGRRALGDGDNSIGDRLPGLFVSVGLEQLDVASSDRVFCLTPPYDTPEQVAFVAMRFDHVERRIWAWPEEQTARYFEAGGGAPRDFEAGWEAVHARGRRAKEAIEAGAFSTAGGTVLYLVSGRKPAAR
ncbi:MAG: hypothetical protein QF464_04960, partial [Myxococcota bacterium]|nr:hypothetical protein [Myxococcota bacterium]